MQAKCSTGYFPSTRFAFEAYNNDLSKNPFNVNAYQIVTPEILTLPPAAGLRMTILQVYCCSIMHSAPNLSLRGATRRGNLPVRCLFLRSSSMNRTRRLPRRRPSVTAPRNARLDSLLQKPCPAIYRYIFKIT